MEKIAAKKTLKSVVLAATKPKGRHFLPFLKTKTVKRFKTNDSKESLKGNSEEENQNSSLKIRQVKKQAVSMLTLMQPKKDVNAQLSLNLLNRNSKPVRHLQFNASKQRFPGISISSPQKRGRPLQSESSRSFGKFTSRQVETKLGSRKTLQSRRSDNAIKKTTSDVVINHADKKKSTPLLNDWLTAKHTFETLPEKLPSFYFYSYSAFKTYAGNRNLFRFMKKENPQIKNILLNSLRDGYFFRYVDMKPILPVNSMTQHKSDPASLSILNLYTTPSCENTQKNMKQLSYNFNEFSSDIKTIDRSFHSISSSVCLPPNIIIKGNFPVTIEENTVLYNWVYIDASAGPVSIGSQNVIGEHVQIQNTVETPLTVGNHNVIESHTRILDGSTIGENNFIEAAATLGPFARIGKNCIISVGSQIFNNTSITQHIIYGKDGHRRPLSSTEILRSTRP